MSELLRAENVHKSYRNGAEAVSVLRGIDLRLRAGQIGVILGPSGVGKSTLLHILGLLDTMDEGRLVYDGRDVSGLSERERDRLRNAEFGFIFQFFHLLPDLTTLENVMLPGMIACRPLVWMRARVKWRRRAEEMLERVGLAHRLKHRPAQLSGGEKQRVAIARALVSEPRIVFCDEPTGNLDTASARSVRALLWELNREWKQTLLIVTHNVEFTEGAHWVGRLADGKLQLERTSPDMSGLTAE